MSKEQKFYDTLKSVFTGADIEGEGGYVNLLKIKSRYFDEVLKEFKTQVDENKIIKADTSFKEEFFDRLYTFFNRYFSESGSVYYVRTPDYQRIYEKIYTDNKDVVLFWKTHMLYYVKSDILFKSMDIAVEDEEKGEFYFYFDVGELEAKQNNEKKELLFEFKEKRKEEIKSEDKKEKVEKIVLTVKYKEGNKKTKINEIAKAAQVPEEVIEKAIKTFKKQAEVDFFINKNAEKFLQEQLDLYLHQILLEDENKFDQHRLNQIKTIKEFAQKLIKFVAQFEDELVRVWNKPKFVLNSNYVVTLDRLPEEIISKIEKHKGLKDQIKEWQELEMVDKDFDFKKRDKEKHRHLPIDTKYFKDLELEILSIFDDLDEALDGVLIHSENYQALNTLKEKYKEKVQCIYIDPPFNTGSDFAYVDKFQDSTWLTLMNDRIVLAKQFLRDDGSFYLHLDHNADYMGKFLMDSLIGKDLFKNKITWKRQIPRGKKAEAKFYPFSADFIYLYANNNAIWNEVKTYNYLTFQEADKKYMKDENGYFRTSDPGSYSNESLVDLFKKGRIYVTNGGRAYVDKNGVLKVENGKIGVKYYRRIINNKVVEEITVDNIWNDIPGMGIVSQEYLNFQTQKPEKLLERIIKASSNEGHFVFDYFMGSATTQAAAHKLNRKWLGVDVGEHFFSVAIPRMKKVLFGVMSGISKELEKEGKLKKGGFFKYYELEQYEDTLRKMKYKEFTPENLFESGNGIFSQYIFFADPKFADVIKLGKKKGLELDFDKLYKNIDFPETISNLLGMPIKRITKSEVVLKDGSDERKVKYDYKNMQEEEKVEFLQILKPLLWWGKE